MVWIKYIINYASAATSGGLLLWWGQGPYAGLGWLLARSGGVLRRGCHVVGCWSGEVGEWLRKSRHAHSSLLTGGPLDHVLHCQIQSHHISWHLIASHHIWRKISRFFLPGSFDGILFDAYPLSPGEAAGDGEVGAFFSVAAKLLRPGREDWWNGVCFMWKESIFPQLIFGKHQVREYLIHHDLFKNEFL